jgi:hypothetical protein
MVSQPTRPDLAFKMVLIKNEETDLYTLIKYKKSQAKTRKITPANT